MEENKGLMMKSTFTLLYIEGKHSAAWQIETETTITILRLVTDLCVNLQLQLTIT